MMYGLYLSASGALANSYRVDVFANNMANSQTPAFKPHLPYISQRAPETIEDQLGPANSHKLLEKLGGGVFAGVQHTSFKVGLLEETGRPLDFALQERDQFLLVQTQGLDGSTQQALTRNGKLSVGPSGTLVTQAGHTVLDAGGSPIRAGANDILTIDHRGQVLDQHGSARGRLNIVSVSDLQSLDKQGDSLFAFSERPQAVGQPALKPGHLEGSAIDPVGAMMSLISATKAMTGNARMITHQDRLLDQAINQFGRLN